MARRKDEDDDELIDDAGTDSPEDEDDFADDDSAEDSGDDDAGDDDAGDDSGDEAWADEVVPRLAALAADVRTRWPDVGRIALWHRDVRVLLGESSVVVAVSAPHRGAAFDAAGLAAGRNTRSYLIQTYARDMGNGNTVMMREIDVPIRVGGRHWGGFRTAYKL